MLGMLPAEGVRKWEVSSQFKNKTRNEIKGLGPLSRTALFCLTSVSLILRANIQERTFSLQCKGKHE